MQTGEQLFSIRWIDVSVIAICVIAWMTLLIRSKAPSVDSFRDFVNTWNSRGGNIIILLGLSIYSFRVGMRFFYHAIGLVSAGKLDEKSALLMLGVQWVTGSVFGLFAGALIKTMTGQEGGTPVPPVTPPGSISTSTVTSSTGLPESTTPPKTP